MEANARHRIAFFRASEAMDQAQTGMRGPLSMSERTQAAMGKLAQAGGGEGLVSKLLVRQDGGFSILLLQARPGFIVPRHRHDSDCMYYVQSGSVRMGQRTLHGGDSFFVPAEVVYTYEAGPEGCEILEIRYGVERYATEFPDQPESYWSGLLASIEESRPKWTQAAPKPKEGVEAEDSPSA